VRIVYLNKVHLDSALPAVNFTLFNAYALAEAGADCFLFAQKSAADLEERKLLESFCLTPLPTLHLHILPEKRHLGLKTNQWFYLKAFRRIKALHQARRLDAVISRDPGALPYLARLKSKTGIAVFYQPHNFYVDLAVRSDVNPKNARKYHLLEKKFIPQMTALLCLQESQAGWFKKYFPAMHVLVAKPGLMKIEPPENDRYANRLIGYVGSLQLKKGIETLLQAMLLLKHRGFKLVLVGGRNPEEMSPVQQRVRELGLSDAVEITGWIAYSKAESYLDKMTVGVIPLQDTFYNRYLTAPNKLFDYLSRGVPIVAADLPAIRDFLADESAGAFFQPEHAEGLAKALLAVLADAQRYQQYGEKARKLAQQYLWKEQAQAMLKLIEREINEKLSRNLAI
jgi:glycosyltransferase involved in cell wall biosynthesis